MPCHSIKCLEQEAEDLAEVSLFPPIQDIKRKLALFEFSFFHRENCSLHRGDHPAVTYSVPEPRCRKHADDFGRCSLNRYLCICSLISLSICLTDDCLPLCIFLPPDCPRTEYLIRQLPALRATCFKPCYMNLEFERWTLWELLFIPHSPFIFLLFVSSMHFFMRILIETNPLWVVQHCEYKFLLFISFFFFFKYLHLFSQRHRNFSTMVKLLADSRGKVWLKLPLSIIYFSFWFLLKKSKIQIFLHVPFLEFLARILTPRRKPKDVKQL